MFKRVEYLLIIDFNNSTSGLSTTDEEMFIHPEEMNFIGYIFLMINFKRPKNYAKRFLMESFIISATNIANELCEANL